ncbi:MAG: aryl-sulfate sulfotransferase [Burkholderiaceae bacterium]
MPNSNDLIERVTSIRERVWHHTALARRLAPLALGVGLTTTLLVACDDDARPAVKVLVDAPMSAGTITPGSTPFVAFVPLEGGNLSRMATVNFVIQPKSGSASKPVSVTYSRDYLERKGYIAAGISIVTLPVFGLYSGASNVVAVTVTGTDASTVHLAIAIPTAAYVDQTGVYDHLQVVQPRSGAIGFDFMYLKTGVGGPVVVDTDGQVRWVGQGVSSSYSALLLSNHFIVGTPHSGELYDLGFDGTVVTSGTLPSPVTAFQHNFEPGKTGILGQPDLAVGGQSFLESVLAEFEADGTPIAQWDLGQILTDYMRANGDDPTAFVRPAVDWFHMNTAIYDPSDDSVIVSSRENFIIKLDYKTQAIKWIFGDTQKYWYTFPSLRAKSLALVGGGLVPIGQHAVTIAPDGSLMLFNDGAASMNQPTGAPAGDARSYAAVSDYTIDATAGTATEAWHYDHGQTYSSAYCSSARQVQDGSLLVDYSYAANGTVMHLVGLDPTRAVVFDYQLANIAGCWAAWNTQPIALEAMSFN